MTAVPLANAQVQTVPGANFSPTGNRSDYVP
jgi:hypothetical protein